MFFLGGETLDSASILDIPGSDDVGVALREISMSALVLFFVTLAFSEMELGAKSTSLKAFLSKGKMPGFLKPLWMLEGVIDLLNASFTNLPMSLIVT